MIDKEEFRLKAVERIQQAKEHAQKWHRDARDDYAFVAGDQWQPDDEHLLKLQNRPVVTFNYSEKMIDAVAGAEVSNRQEVTYKPRQIESGPLAELWTNAARWVRDECNAEDEETDAFRDALIAGMGWIETKMDYTEDADGMPVQNRVDPIEMYWDPAATKPGLADRRYDIRGQWVDNRTLAKKYPGKVIIGSGDDVEDGSTGIIRTGHRYEEENEVDSPDRHDDQTMIWNYQCVELEPYYRVATGNGDIQEVAVKDFNAMKAKLNQFGLKYVKEFKKVYYHALIADETIIDFGLSACQHGFTRHCITGKRDRNKNQWYGLVRVMKDPQRWANKWLAQIMHIINSNAKGGLLAEQGAFVDPRKAQDEWSSPDSVTLLNEGGLAKVQQKQMTAYPSGLAQLMEFALNSLPQVTGINLEALGLANRDQANVLEQSRKQAAYGLLAPVFDSLRRYRKMQGKVLLYFITEYISDGRLIKVNGVGSEQYIPLTKTPDGVKFDIIVDQSSTAPDVKERTWSALMQIVPAMIKANMPMPPDLLTYAPLPAALIQKWQQFILQKQQEAQQQQVSPQQVEQMQEQIQQLTQENQQLQNDQQIEMSKLQLAQQKQEAELQLKAAEIDGQLRIKQMEAQGKLTLQEQTVNHDMQLNTHRTQGDLKIKAATAGLNPTEEGEVKFGVDTTEMTQALEKITSGFEETMKALIASINAPKTVTRDAEGRVTGVRTVK